MKYCIITEEKEVFKVERTIGNSKIEVVFSNITEEDKKQQLQTAVFLRFNEDYLIDPDNENQVFNKLKYWQWLKLIPQTEDKYNLDIPSLSLMA